jgi:hypothetical protein
VDPDVTNLVETWLEQADVQARRDAAERDAEVHRHVDWRHDSTETRRMLDPPRRGAAELPHTLEDVIGSNLIYIDESGAGVPQDRFWCEHAMRVVHDDQHRTNAALEAATSDLATEQQLRDERQHAADEAHAAYVRLALDEQEPREVGVLEALVHGHRVRVVQPQPTAKRMPVLLEGRGRSDTSPVARAYWAWQDRLTEVESGPRHDRRVVELADGKSMTRLSWLSGEVSRLQARAGACAHWLSLVAEHFERYATPRPEPGPVTLTWRDPDGTEFREQVPADLAANLVRF